MPGRAARSLVLALIAVACSGAGSCSRGPASGWHAVFEDGPRDAWSARLDAPGFLKGQLHAHTNASGDSETPASTAIAWFAQHGFDFVVLTDHNRVKVASSRPDILVFPGVEITQNFRTCDPPPSPGEACLLHVNALFVRERPWWVSMDPPPGLRRVDIYTRAVDRALALGGLAQVNHPNFHGGANLEVLLEAAKHGAILVEIANEAVDSTNEGAPGRTSTEELWDAALVRGARLFGTATDDAHHYDDAAAVRAAGRTAYVGDRGYVMVRAARDEASIRDAITRGDFYASTGLALERLVVSSASIEIDVREDGIGPFSFDVIANGKAVDHVDGSRLRIDPRTYGPGYVRVRVAEKGARRAWTQPLWR